MKKLIALLCAFTILFSMPTTALAETEPTKETTWPKGPSIAGGSAVLMDVSTGLILYEKNPNKKNYPASTTKILTTLLAIENAPLSDIVTFSHNAVFNLEAGSSHIARNEDEQLTMEQSLYGIMLESANEVSNAVAEHVSGTTEEFAKLMTTRAKELGCTNTNFVNPHGLFSENHYTSAHDLALISRAAYQNEIFRKICGTKRYVIPPTNKHDEPFYCNNHHKMSKDGGKYYYEYWAGGKTGYTTKSKYSLVTFAKRNDTTLVCVVMNEESINDQYTDTKALLDFGFNNYTSYKISNINNSQSVDNQSVNTNSDEMNSMYDTLFGTTNTEIFVNNNSFITLPNTADFTDTTKTVSFDPNANISTGENIIGSITYEYDNKIVGSTNIICNKSNTVPISRAAISPQKNLKTATIQTNRNLRPIIIVVIISIIILAILLYYFLIERPRLKRRKAYYQRKKTRESFNNSDLTNMKM